MKLYFNHKKYDVDPWVKYGNTPNDKTTKEVTHRRFIEGVDITGRPNVRP